MRMCFTKGVVQNVEKNYGKTHAPESNFNKVMLATLLKRDSVTRVFYDFFKIIKGNIFMKHLWSTASECWQLEKSS